MWNYPQRGGRTTNVSQYADGSSFMVRKDKKYVDELVRLIRL